MDTAPSQSNAPAIDRTTRVLETLCTLFGVLGCLILALNLSFSPYGWVFATISAAIGIPWARRVGAPMMMTMQCVFLVLDVLGVYRNFLPYFLTTLA